MNIICQEKKAGFKIKIAWRPLGVLEGDRLATAWRPLGDRLAF